MEIMSLEKKKPNVWVIWKVVLSSFDVIEGGLAWKLGSGEKCRMRVY